MKEANTRPAIQYVEDILLDKSSSEFALLRSSQNPNADSDIAIIGRSDDSDFLAQYLLSYDSFDNIDGSRNSDDLPDFAGETFDIIQFDKDFRALDTLSIRERTVSLVLSSLDTQISLSPYDISGVEAKLPSKLVIINDPYLSEYGLFDVDTLFKQSDCRVNLVSSLDLSITKVKEEAKKNILIFYNSELYDSDIYFERFSSLSFPGTKIMTFSSEKSDSLLHNAIDSIMERGEEVMLDAILVDDYSIDINALKLEYADMISVLNESSLKYTRVFSNKLSIIDGKELVADYCFNLLRKLNLFTHKIVFPQENVYNAVPSANGDRKFLLIPNNYVQK